MNLVNFNILAFSCNLHVCKLLFHTVATKFVGIGFLHNEYTYQILAHIDNKLANLVAIMKTFVMSP